jgi:mRNA-degrading endonuclease RelE of RelBE toxin-antitoxin system
MPPLSYEVFIAATATEDLAALPTNRFDTITRRINALKNGIPGSVKRLSNFGYDCRLRVGDYRILFDVRVLKLRFVASCIAAMPTLHHPVRKKEKANTRTVAIKKARTLVARKAPAKKKAARRYARAMLANSRCIINEDALDAHLIREARQADRGKARFTVNELRVQRGLAVI